MTKKLSLVLWVNIAMLGSTTYAQTLFGARPTGVGAYSALVSDTRGFDINPAGLAWIKDWDFSAATYAATSGGDAGFVFHGLSFGKRFLEDNAAAAQYTPGTSLEFILPTKIIQGGNTPVSFDMRIKYEEPFALGLAHRFSSELAMGAGLRFIQTKVTDTQYELDPVDTAFAISLNEYTARTWRLDLGLAWKPLRDLTLALVARSVAEIQSSEVPSTFGTFRLPTTRALEIGAGYSLSPSFRIAADVSTGKTGALGCEWAPLNKVAIRSGLLCSSAESPFAYGLSTGLGWSYEFLDIDASYLHFFDQEKRKSSGVVSQFNAAAITRVDLNSYTHDRFSLSVRAIFGKIREPLVRIGSVEMLGGVYPSSYESLAYKPIGKVRVKNISDKPIQARARFYVDRFMDVPTETPPVHIAPGAEEVIPFTAVFNARVKEVAQLMIRDGDIYISATAVDDYDDKLQTRLLIHGRNDWDGDVHTLRYFVMPDDPEVLRFSREVLRQEKDSLMPVPKEMHPFLSARILFNAFTGKLTTVSDPRQSADFVQYPSETLKLRTGDCDDMTVLFSSLLNSIGIATAFVEVVPPGHPDKGHIYLMFDTGLDPKYGASISENPKRYIIRRSKNGSETIWLPIETTVSMRGFYEAWTTGAQEYFDDVEIGLGLIKGWVRIIDVY